MKIERFEDIQAWQEATDQRFHPLPASESVAILKDHSTKDHLTKDYPTKDYPIKDYPTKDYRPS